MRVPGIFLLLLLIILLAAGCETNRVRSAQEHYDQKRFAAAIQEMDSFVPSAKNGALATQGEKIRSDSYYELGILARDRQRWDLAIKFLKLSNSEKADMILGDIYKFLAHSAEKKKDYIEQLRYVDAIVREIPRSYLIPEMLYQRIKLQTDIFDNPEYAWQDYMRLYASHPGDVYEISSRKIVGRYMPVRIAYGKKLTETGYYTDALQVYFELANYPVVDPAEIRTLIAETYIAQAEYHLAKQDYFSADGLFRIAMEYDSTKKPAIDRRLLDIVSLFQKEGDSLVARREFDNALTYYRKTFDIIPNYAPAVQAIERVEVLKRNIEEAKVIFSQAVLAEGSGRNSEALRLFQQAYKLDAKPEYQQRANTIQNMLEADKDPVAFARRIVGQYGNGMIVNRIEKQRQDLLKRYKTSDVRDSGWKFLLSTGQYKYEARYDLITPRETFLYVWQVNLRDRSLTPLNTISEALMK
jgi:tetratricopeptide (TPR) repeat protein